MNSIIAKNTDKVDLVLSSVRSSARDVCAEPETAPLSEKGPGAMVDIPLGRSSDDAEDGETSAAHTNSNVEQQSNKSVSNTQSTSKQHPGGRNEDTWASRWTCCRWKPLAEWSRRHKIHEPLRFGLRVTVALSLASLFVLCQTPHEEDQALPHAIWVYVTAGVCSWQASPDLGSVCKKVWQRFVGTFLGGSLGLSLGAISLLIPVGDDGDVGWRALYLGGVGALMTFGIVVGCTLGGFRGHYAAILGNVTAGMALLAFSNPDPEEAWKMGVFRIVNILVGCLLGSVVSLVVFPVSTQSLIEQRMAALATNTGRAARRVLSNARVARRKSLPRYHSLILEGKEDEARDATIGGIAELHTIQALLPLLDYDPTFRNGHSQRRRIVDHWKIRLDRILRIQMNVLWLDNMLRSNYLGDDELPFVDRLVILGEHLEDLLDVSHRSLEERMAAEVVLLHEDLPRIRRARACAEATGRRSSTTIVDDPTVSLRTKVEAFDGFDEAGQTRFVRLFLEHQTDTFCRVLEMLVLRCLRYHHLRDDDDDVDDDTAEDSTIGSPCPTTEFGRCRRA